MFKRIGLAFGASAKATGRVLPTILRDIAGLAGVGLIAYGAWLVVPAAGFIVAGVLLLAGVILVSAKAA